MTKAGGKKSPRQQKVAKAAAPAAKAVTPAAQLQPPPGSPPPGPFMRPGPPPFGGQPFPGRYGPPPHFMMGRGGMMMPHMMAGRGRGNFPPQGPFLGGPPPHMGQQIMMGAPMMIPNPFVRPMGAYRPPVIMEPPLSLPIKSKKLKSADGKEAENPALTLRKVPAPILPKFTPMQLAQVLRPLQTKPAQPNDEKKSPYVPVPVPPKAPITKTQINSDSKINMTNHEVLRHLCGFYLVTDDECTCADYIKKHKLMNRFQKWWEQSKLEEFKEQGHMLQDDNVKERLDKFMMEHLGAKKETKQEKLKMRKLYLEKKKARDELIAYKYEQQVKLDRMRKARRAREDHLFQRFTKLVNTKTETTPVNRAEFRYFLQEVDTSREVFRVGSDGMNAGGNYQEGGGEEKKDGLATL